MNADFREQSRSGEFLSPLRHSVMSRDIRKARTPIQGSGFLFFGGVRGCPVPW